MFEMLRWMSTLEVVEQISSDPQSSLRLYCYMLYSVY